MAPDCVPRLHAHDTVESLDCVCHAGRRIYLLPGRPCLVEAGPAAANGRWRPDAAAPVGRSPMHRLRQWWQDLWASRHRACLGHRAWIAAQPPRWPATWPYADCGIARAGGSLFRPDGMSPDSLAPDAIVDARGRILRL